MKNIFFPLALLCCFSVHAQSGWRTVTSPVTDTLCAVDFGSSSTGFGCGRNGKVVKTTNTGGSWSSLNTSFTFDVNDINATSSSIVYATGESGNVQKSTNGGTSWSSQTSGTAQHLRGISMINSAAGVMVGDSGIARVTINGGATWTTGTTGTTNVLRDVQLVSSVTGFACGGNGTLIKTTNGGNTWSLLNTTITADLTGVNFDDSLNGFACGAGGTLIHTTNGGVNWTVINTTYNLNYHAIIRFNSSMLVLTADNDWSVVSYNNGVTWKIFYGGAGSLYGGCVTSNGTGIGVGSNGYIFRSHTAQWTVNNSDSTSTIGLMDIMFTDSIHGYASTNGGVYKTADGLHWSFVAIPGSFIVDLEFPTPTTGFGCDPNTGAIYKTTDAGQTWAATNSPVTDDAYDLHFLDSLTGYLAAVNIYKTVNGGASWTQVFSDNAADFRVIDITSSDTIFALAETNRVYRSSDAGATWRVVYETPYVTFPNDLFFVTPNTGYLAINNSGSQNIYKTIDGGENWLPVLLASSIGEVDEMYFISPDTGYAVGRDGSNVPFAMKTLDGGLTWSVMTLQVTTGELKSVCFPDPRHGFAATNGIISNIQILQFQCDDPTNYLSQVTYEETNTIDESPPWSWATDINNLATVRCSATDAMGNTVIGGVATSPLVVNSQTLTCTNSPMGYVMKLDSAGNTLWGIQFCNDGQIVYVNDLCYDAAGNIYVIGDFGGTLTLGSFSISSWALNARQCFIAKLTAAGTPVWLRKVSAVSNGVTNGWSIEVTPAQELIVSGHCTEPDVSFGTITVNTGYPIGMHPYWVAKYTLAGVPVWATVPGSVRDDYRNPMTVDSSGNIILVNTYAYIIWGSDTLDAMSQVGWDVLVSKLSGQNGSEMWRTTINGLEECIGYDVATDVNENVYVCGTLNHMHRFDTLWISSICKDDGFIVKYDPAGNLLWARTEGSMGDEAFTRIICGPGNMVYMAGHVDRSARFADTTLVSGNYGSFFVGACDGNGNMRWVVAQPLSYGPLGDPHWFASGWGIGMDADTNIYVGGDFKNQGTVDSTLIQSVLVGKLVPNTNVMNSVAPANADVSAAVNLYPNPASDIVTLGINSPESGITQIRIMDVTGKLVMSQQVTASVGLTLVTINTSLLAPGVYTVIIDGPVIATRSMIKE